jgi:tetratricopeptide (TPR) repeat protein
MLKKSTLVVLALRSIFIYSNSQIVQKPDSIIRYEKAKYLKQDLNKFLSTHTEYPYTEMTSMVNGDVVFSFIINRNGKMESLALKDYPNASFLNSSKNAINSLDGEWHPAKLNDSPVDMKYLIVFRFRAYFERKPFDCKAQGKNFFEKQKYKRALKTFNSGIEDNKYDYELYELRSKVKEILGDNEGAKNDQIKSLRLKDEIMSIIDITVIGVRRTVKLGESIITVPSRNQ